MLCDWKIDTYLIYKAYSLAKHLEVGPSHPNPLYFVKFVGFCSYEWSLLVYNKLFYRLNFWNVTLHHKKIITSYDKIKQISFIYLHYSKDFLKFSNDWISYVKKCKFHLLNRGNFRYLYVNYNCQKSLDTLTLWLNITILALQI